MRSGLNAGHSCYSRHPYIQASVIRAIELDIVLEARADGGRQDKLSTRESEPKDSRSQEGPEYMTPDWVVLDRWGPKLGVISELGAPVRVRAVFIRRRDAERALSGGTTWV